jgi:hypothetical protein
MATKRGSFFHGTKSATSSNAGKNISNTRAAALKSAALAKRNAKGGGGGQRRDSKGRFS